MFSILKSKTPPKVIGIFATSTTLYFFFSLVTHNILSEKLAQYLTEKETITGEEFMKILDSFKEAAV